MRHVALFLLCALSACDPRQRIESDPSAPPFSAVPTPPAVAPAAPPTPVAAVSKGLPILGDPLGLLSKGNAEPAVAPPREQSRTLSPGALMAKPVAATAQAEIPAATDEPARSVRDPRAVERSSTREVIVPMPRASDELHELSAASLFRDLRDSPGKVRVLFLYAAYCKACRGAMPNVLESARRYYGRGVRFTAASVDKDRDQFASYAPVLDGVFQPTLITPDGTTGRELKSLGVPLEGTGFSIPMIVVLDRKQRLVAYGNTSLADHLERTLDPLLAE